MSRGSISSWQDYGRRNSQIMPQFSGGPVEFMTSDDYERQRGDGWFLSYTKIAGIIAVFVIGVIAAGFLGWYINSLPKTKSYDTLDLLTDEIEDIEAADENFKSPHVHPLRYRLELEPIVDISGASMLKGRVTIDFRVNDTAGLTAFSLSARNISVESYRLSSAQTGEDRARKRIADFEAVTAVDRPGDASRTVYSAQNDMITMVENKTVSYDKNAEEFMTNDTTDSGFSAPPLNQPGFSAAGGAQEATTTTAQEFPLDPSAQNSSEMQVTRYDVDEDNEVHTIHLAAPLQRGTYSLEIFYEALIDDNAFFIANYSTRTEERWLLGTKLRRATGARHLFPVFDDAVHKSVFSLSVARPFDTTVLSNMPSRTLRDGEKTVDYFDDTPPLAPHNFAFLMGHVGTIGATLLGDSATVARFWCDLNKRSQEMYLLDKLNTIVTNLIGVFSVPYPFPKLDIVALPPGVDENTGSPGLIAVTQSTFYTTDESPLVTKIDALRVLISLTGHQWFDKFMNTDRTHEWIFEGSLIYLQYDIVGKIDLSPDSADSFVADVQTDLMEIDGYSISRPPHETVNHRLSRSFNDDHAKGACLTRMLHGAINDTAFRNGYRKLITRWKHNFTDIADFMSIMEEEATELPPDVSLDEAMSSWYSQGGYPLVTVVRDYYENAAVVYQEQFALDRPLESISKFWHIPLSYVNELSDWSSPSKVWFPMEPKITLRNVAANESWVLFNVNKTGYYRVHYDDRNWLLLRTALGENHQLFPPETRASLVDDVFSLAAMGSMKYEVAFDFVEYMRTKERHYLPWSALLRHMLKLNRLLYETAVFNDFQEFVVRFVSPLYSEVGSRLEEGSQLTMIAIRLACVFEHPECLNWSRSVFQNANTDSEMNAAVPLYLRESFYCTIARYGTRKEWNHFMERVSSIEDEEERKRLLSSFACFQAPWVLQSILNEILHENRFNEDEISTILRAFPRNPAAAQAASRFVRANWQEIAQRFSGSYAVLKSFVLSMINGLTTEPDLEDLQTFRENNHDSMKGTRYAAALVEANGNFVTMWLRHSLTQIEGVLKAEAESPSFS